MCPARASTHTPPSSAGPAETPSRHDSSSDALNADLLLALGLKEHRDRIQLILGRRRRQPAQPHGHIVEPAGGEPRPEMPQARHDHLDDREPDLRRASGPAPSSPCPAPRPGPGTGRTSSARSSVHDRGYDDRRGGTAAASGKKIRLIGHRRRSEPSSVSGHRSVPPGPGGRCLQAGWTASGSSR